MNTIYESERLCLKILNEKSAPEVLTFLERDKDFFEPVEADKPVHFYTEKFQRMVLKLEYKAFLKNVFVRFYVYRKNYPDEIIGTVSLSNILRIPYNSAMIGYKFSRSSLGQGYATEAVTLASHIAFHDLGLQRINALVLPDNQDSFHLLERIGYEKEGICRKAVLMNGEYKDHLLYALVCNK